MEKYQYKFKNNYRASERCGDCKHAELVTVENTDKLICKNDGEAINYKCVCDAHEHDHVKGLGL
ncbi:MAG: hypothetical protein ACRCZ2_09480 [Fusobacteriaceae bacterium]